LTKLFLAFRFANRKKVKFGTKKCRATFPAGNIVDAFPRLFPRAIFHRAELLLNALHTKNSPLKNDVGSKKATSEYTHGNFIASLKSPVFEKLQRAVLALLENTGAKNYRSYAALLCLLTCVNANSNKPPKLWHHTLGPNIDVSIKSFDTWLAANQAHGSLPRRK
jgi:hypothetical protein